MSTAVSTTIALAVSLAHLASVSVAPVAEDAAAEAPPGEAPATTEGESPPPEESAPDPAEESPAEEAPAEEASTEEVPAEETPAEETPAEDDWGADEEPLDPAGSTPPPPVVAVAPEGAPASRDEPMGPREKLGRDLVISGAVLTGLGGVSLLLIAVPAAIAKRVNLNRADEGSVFVEDSENSDYYRRAKTYDDLMEGAFWAGLSAVVVGIPLLITGSVIKKRAARDVAQRLQFDTSGMQVRF